MIAEVYAKSVEEQFLATILSNKVSFADKIGISGPNPFETGMAREKYRQEVEQKGVSLLNIRETLQLEIDEWLSNSLT